MPEPEAPVVETPVQGNVGQAMTMAREQLAARSAEQPPVDAPETGATGTGAAETPKTDEVDWSNEDARQAYIAERYLAKEDHDRRMRDQKKNLQQEINAARAARQKEERFAELDSLRQSDPVAYAERLESDPEAASLVLERASQIQPQVLQHATTSLAMGLAEKLFEVRPDLRPVFEDGGDWQKVTDPATGGIFGYVDRTAREDERVKAVESFKKSKEYKAAIEEARRLGAQDALPGYHVDSPAAETASTPSGETTPKFQNNAQKAAWLASRQMGSRGLDLSKVGSR